MIEVKELLAPCAAIFALLFAVFAFLLPQAIRLGNQTRSMLSEVEVPDTIRKSWRFRLGTSGHFALLGFVSISSLLTGAVYCPLIMHRIVQYYLGSQTHSANEILGNFNELTQFIMALSIIIVVTALAMVANDLFISENYPALLKVYIKKILGIKTSDEEVSGLLPEANSLFGQGKYLESVLYSTAALDHAMRSKLGVSRQYGWRALTNIALHELGASNAAILDRIGAVRSSAIHPTPNTSITKDEAKEILEASRGLIKQLGEASQQEPLASTKEHPKPEIR